LTDAEYNTGKWFQFYDQFNELNENFVVRIVIIIKLQTSDEWITE